MRALVIALLCASCGGSENSSAAVDPNEGKKDGPCYPNNTCNAGLSCVSSKCVEIADSAPLPDTTVVDTGPAADTAETGGKPPFEMTTLAASCDEMGLADVAGVSADDSVSALAALPFAFTYFGDTITQWSMSSNGFAQLFTAAGGTPVAAPNNDALLAAPPPSGLVAPFWDDLEPIFSNSRAGVLGTAPNRRFVMYWLHWSIKGQTATVRVSFQLKLFETTNVIEFHYCGMAPEGNALASGGSATIGLMNVAGTRGMQRSFNTASTVATGRAFRFTP